MFPNAMTRREKPADNKSTGRKSTAERPADEISIKDMSKDKIPVSVISLALVSGVKLSKVHVRSELIKDFNVIPLRILTPNNERIIVDKTTDIRRQASLKAGGIGIRYTCTATIDDEHEHRQREIFLYKDEDSWYLEEAF